MFDQIIEESKASIEKEDLEVLLPLIAKVEPMVILEIGIHQGYSMETWHKAFPKAVIFGIEKNMQTSKSIKGFNNGYFYFRNLNLRNNNLR